MEKDFTQFDYIGFWFYNDSNRPVRVYTILTTQEYGDGISHKPRLGHILLGMREDRLRQAVLLDKIVMISMN